MVDDPRSWGAVPAPTQLPEITVRPDGTQAEAANDPRSWGAIPNVEPEPEGVPAAFLDRLAAGNALQKAMGKVFAGGAMKAGGGSALQNTLGQAGIWGGVKAFGSGFGEGFGDEQLGWSPEHVQWMRDVGIFRDPATGRGGLMRYANEGFLQPIGVAGDLMVRSASGVAHGLANTFGQLVEDAGGLLGNPDRAREEALNALNWAIMRGDTDLSRPEAEARKIAPRPSLGPHDQIVGALPSQHDFKQAANVISGGPPPDDVVEENVRQLWRERGQTPAEAVHDAANDNLLRGQLLTKPYNVRDRSGIAPVVGGTQHPATPRSTLAHTGNAGIDRLFEDDRLRDAIDNPAIDREHQVPDVVGSSRDLTPSIVPPKDATQQGYVDQAMENLMATSRTAKGEVNVATQPGKETKIVEGLKGDQAASRARENVESVMRDLYDRRRNMPQTTEEMEQFIDDVARQINRGIVRPDVSILRQVESSTKTFGYTPVAQLADAHQAFAAEFAQRLASNANPIETAAWVEWNAMRDHFWADGVGKTSKALSSIPLMRAGLPLPKYPSNQIYFSHNKNFEDFAQAFRSWVPIPGPTRANRAAYALGFDPAEIAQAQEALARNAQPAEIAALPILQKAKAMQAGLPGTNKTPGYGSKEYRDNREFVFEREDKPPERVVGWENAVTRLRNKAESYAGPEGVKRQRRVIIVTGPGGAGKSSQIMEPIARGGHYAIIDADDAKPVMPEYRNGIGATAVHEESSDLEYGFGPQNPGHGVLDRFLADGSNVIIGKIGSKDTSIQRLAAEAREAGYHVDLIDVDHVPPELSYRRQVGRFLETGRINLSQTFEEVASHHYNSAKFYPIYKKEGLFDGQIQVDVSQRPAVITDGTDTALAGVLRRGQRREREREADRGVQARRDAAATAAVQKQQALKAAPPTIYLDKRFPHSFTVDGITFDPAEPMLVRENVARRVEELTTRGGMKPAAAAKVANLMADRAENAWYKSHGINRDRAEQAYEPYRKAIDHAASDLTSAQMAEAQGIFETPDLRVPREPPARRPPPAALPDASEMAKAREIIDEDVGDEPLRAVGAEVAGPLPSIAQQPIHPPGALMASIKQSSQLLLDIGRDLQMWAAPMARGSKVSMPVAKDFANALRRNRLEWSILDDHLAKQFTREQRERMYNAMDEESVMRQEGKTSQHMGIATLSPEERAAVLDINQRAQLVWAEMKELGMVEGDGLPFYTPRMIYNVATATEKDGAMALNTIGRNLTTKNARLLHRKYLLAEDTEAAAKAKLGEAATLARDIRVTPLALAKLEDAIAGRRMINEIKAIGDRLGEQLISEDGKPVGSQYGWFTMDHPAFKKWGPDLRPMTDLETAPFPAAGKMTPKLDENGNPIMIQKPIFIRSDFEGPLKAVLSEKNGKAYEGAMALKSKTMSMIMLSPMIHNAVEYGRAFPAMPGRMLTLQTYFRGNAAKLGYEYRGELPYIFDVLTGNRVKLKGNTMRPDLFEAVDHGMAPIGHRFAGQDISSIMEEPNLTPGRSFTAKILGAVPGLFSEKAGDAVKTAIDKLGDFTHNTLLWDRIGDLQMGIYTNLRDDMVAKGIDPEAAKYMAAHFANRYAGSLPVEAMSNQARKVANMLMFSRTFTLGNLGVMKDALTGLPRDVQAQIERDMGEFDPKAANYAKHLARRKAAMVIFWDMCLMYVTNALLQHAFQYLRGDTNLNQEEQGYATRFHARLQRLEEHPFETVSPLSVAGGVIGAGVGGPVGAVVGTALGTGLAQLKYLSPTYENEPGKQDRVLTGYAKDGTGIYLRNPLGKIGEEFTGYLSTPIDMMTRKLATVPRGVWHVISNDAGYGRKVYDPHPFTDGTVLQSLANAAEQVAGEQFPTGQLGAARDLVTGEGDKTLNELHAFGPFGGFTFSKGAPGGPAVGELYSAKEQYEFNLNAALPDIRKQILRGDVQGAVERMTQIGVPPGLQRFYIRTTINPATRLSGKALRDFYNYATPEERARMEGYTQGR
jgi:hypothetical protein